MPDVIPLAKAREKRRRELYELIADAYGEVKDIATKAAVSGLYPSPSSNEEWVDLVIAKAKLMRPELMTPSVDHAEILSVLREFAKPEASEPL
jgi:hypothetical protein